MADELLDLVDENDNVIGTVWKSEAHSDFKLLHRHVAAIIFNNNEEVLLQQRSLNKIKHPGMWEISVVGHVLANESPEKAAYRELKEELGILAKLVYFDKFFTTYKKSSENQESRFTWVYYGIVKDKLRLKLQVNEVSNAKWIKLNKIQTFARKNDFDLNRVLSKKMLEIAKNLKII